MNLRDSVSLNQTASRPNYFSYEFIIITAILVLLTIFPIAVHAQKESRSVLPNSLLRQIAQAGGTYIDEHWSGSFTLAGINGTINAVAVSGNDIYVGGNFTYADGVACKNVAHWDGTQWKAMGSGVDNYVNAIVVSGSDVYVAGSFWIAGGSTVNNIAKWNGTAWSKLGNGLDGNVQALAYSNGILYAGGSFTQSNGGPVVNHIAQWNGTAWSALGSGVDNLVEAIAVNGTDIYVGGQFLNAGAVSAARIAKWDGTSWSALGTGCNGEVRGLAANGSTVYATGIFVTAGGVSAPHLASWDGSTWSSVGGGLLGFGYAVQYASGKLWVGGSFTKVGSTPANCIAGWDGSTWSVLNGGVNGPVNAIAVAGSDVYVGGDMSGAGAIPANHLARWNGTTWNGFGSEANASVSADAVRVIKAFSSTSVFAAGNFTYAGGNPAGCIARWDGQTWSNLGGGFPGLGYVIYALAGTENNLYAGGQFGRVTPTFIQNIARWDGTSWSALSTGANGPVYSLAQDGNNLYAGGFFTTAGGVSSSYIAKWDGSAWSPLGTGLSGPCLALAVSGNDVYAGGNFATAGGVTVNSIARWDGTSWHALGSGIEPGGGVNAIVVIGSDVYAGGSFSTAGGKSITNLAKWDGSTWSSVGNAGGPVFSLAEVDGDIYAGGYFWSVGGHAAANIARLHSGTWSGLGSGCNSIVYAVAAMSTEVYAGGKFTLAGEKNSVNFAQWHNSAPVAVNDTFLSVGNSGPTSVPVLSNDSDPNGDALIISAVTQGAHGTVSISAGNIDLTYKPNAGYHGTDSFTYTIDDGVAKSATATVSVLVNSLPIAGTDSPRCDEDASTVISVLANDSDPDGDTLSITHVTTPAHGTAQHNIDKTITYTPAADYNGSDSFSYTISDGNGGTATATVNVTVDPVNDPPLANDDSAVTNEDTVVTIVVLGNDSDPDGDSLNVTSLADPAHGTAVINGDNSLTYTPAANFFGSDSFDYTISDRNGGTATATVSITVNPVNDAPIAVNDSAETKENTAVTVAVLANDSDAEGDAMTVTAVSKPAHGTVALNADGTISYKPFFQFSGVDSFTYTVSDGKVDSTASVNVTVIGAPHIESGLTANPNPATVGETVQISCSANGGVLPLAWHWEFGDGTSSDSGASVDHVFSPAASYTVTATVTAADGQKSSRVLVVVIKQNAAGASPGGTGADSDGDGFSDAFETALGSNAQNASSTPLEGQSAPEPLALTISKMQIRLNFTKPQSDQINFSGSISLPAGFSTKGQRVGLDIGGVIRVLELDAKGKSPRGDSTMQLSVKSKKGVVAAQSAKFKMALKRGDFAADLGDEGFTTDVVKQAPLHVTVDILFNGALYQKIMPQSYSSTGKSGSSK